VSYQLRDEKISECGLGCGSGTITGRCNLGGVFETDHRRGKAEEKLLTPKASVLSTAEGCDEKGKGAKKEELSKAKRGLELKRQRGADQNLRGQPLRVAQRANNIKAGPPLGKGSKENLLKKKGYL